jgi:hypothetical protein
VGVRAVEQSGVELFVTFLRRRDGRHYTMRLSCAGWPAQPASVVFVDPTTGQDVGPDVWPSDGEQAIKRTSNPRFICLPGIREYHAGHGAFQPTAHNSSLTAIVQQIIAAVEARG